MQIVIEYESSWRNSFLDGSNNKPLPKDGRKFIGSMTSLKTAGNFKKHEISKDTVMGVLNRLIGDQRKLYQTRQSADYYFAEIEKTLKPEDVVDEPLLTNEMVYIRNISGSTDQNSFTGLIKADVPAFKANYATQLWGVLWLSLPELIKFILNEDMRVPQVHEPFDPILVSHRIEQLGKEKPLNVENELIEVLDFFAVKFPDISYLTAKQQLPFVSLYTSALYLQVERLSKQYDLSDVLTKSGGLSGISKRGFTKKDFMKAYTTGRGKIVWGNPFLLKEKKKGEGEVVSTLTKASGKLTINLEISKEQARDLEEKIESAGVSTFYLGKKGLAYVVDIR